MGAKPGSLDSYPGGGAGTGVTDISPSDTSDVDGINLKSKFKIKLILNKGGTVFKILRGRS